MNKSFSSSLQIDTFAKKSQIKQRNIVITTGFALFAMFFGAGNLVFPLYIGANAGQHIFLNALGFLIGGIGIPFLGLLAASMFHGDYWAFFNRLGKIPAFLIITFLMIIIGPLGAMPRTETLVFNTIASYCPYFMQTNAIFSLFFCTLIFVLAYRETKIVNILGLILSPIKIITFSLLIIVGMLFKEPMITNSASISEVLKDSLIQGYSTLDLLAAVFFCTVAFKGIEQSKNQLEMTNLNLTKMIINSSLIGMALISVVYIGFMFVAYNHATSLQGIPAEQIVKAISSVVLGKFGELFVCIAVSFACLATALALAEVCSNYLYKVIFNHRVSKVFCLIIVTITTYSISNLGFKTIMYYMVPVLEVVYPALITLSIMNIFYKWKGTQMVKLPVFLTVTVFLIMKLL
jgi:LIVCS family branched-chain amino acid:cation transporter